MRTTLDDAARARAADLLADGATGTNYFGMGLGPGEPPEMWNLDHPDRVRELHEAFVAAGADVILTNTFGCNRYRLELHGAADRAVRDRPSARRSWRSEVAAAADRPVLVAGSVGPTGELLDAARDDDRGRGHGRVRRRDQRTARRRRRHRLDRDQVGTRARCGPPPRAAIECGVPYAVTGIVRHRRAAR